MGLLLRQILYYALPRAAVFWLLPAEHEHGPTASPGSALGSICLLGPSHGGTGRAQAQTGESTGTLGSLYEAGAEASSALLQAR